MADMSTPLTQTELVASATSDPFQALTSQVQAVQEKISDAAVGEYQQTIEQSTNINELNYQAFIHKLKLESDLKRDAAVNELAMALAEQHNLLAVIEQDQINQRLALASADSQKDLTNSYNQQNLNTALMIGATQLVSQQGSTASMNLAYGDAISTVQTINTVTAVNATRSAVSNQRMVNTGTMAGVGQASSPTSVNA